MLGALQLLAGVALAGNGFPLVALNRFEQCGALRLAVVDIDALVHGVLDGPGPHLSRRFGVKGSGYGLLTFGTYLSPPVSATL